MGSGPPPATVVGNGVGAATETGSDGVGVSEMGSDGEGRAGVASGAALGRMSARAVAAPPRTASETSSGGAQANNLPRISCDNGYTTLQ